MLFVIVGVVSIVLHLLDIGPSAAWNWSLTGDLWKFVLPFVSALLWWTWADTSGLNKRREIEKMEAKKDQRRRDNLASLGMIDKNRRKR